MMHCKGYSWDLWDGFIFLFIKKPHINRFLWCIGSMRIHTNFPCHTLNATVELCWSKLKRDFSIHIYVVSPTRNDQNCPFSTPISPLLLTCKENWQRRAPHLQHKYSVPQKNNVRNAFNSLWPKIWPPVADETWKYIFIVFCSHGSNWSPSLQLMV